MSNYVVIVGNLEQLKLELKEKYPDTEDFYCYKILGFGARYLDRAITHTSHEKDGLFLIGDNHATHEAAVGVTINLHTNHVNLTLFDAMGECTISHTRSISNLPLSTREWFNTTSTKQKFAALQEIHLSALMSFLEFAQETQLEFKEVYTNINKSSQTKKNTLKNLPLEVSYTHADISITSSSLEKPLDDLWPTKTSPKKKWVLGHKGVVRSKS